MSVTINGHSYKPTPKFFGTPHLGVYLGVELELDVKHWTSNEDGWCHNAAEEASAILGDFVYFKHDGSIRGVEIVSHPASLHVHRQRWKKFFAGVKLFTVTERDGLHVHFTKQGLTKHQLWLVHQFVNSQKPGDSWLVKLAGRDFSNTARRIIKPESKIDDFAAAGKYESINCVPTATVEVRLFAATLDYQEFMLRLEFTAAIVQAVQQGTDPLTLESLKNFLRSHPKRFPVLVPWLAKEKQL